MDPAEASLPPDEISFRGFAAEPLPDGRRVRVSLELTPFQERPSIELEVLDPTGERVANSTIVEAVDPRMSVTMHLRGELAPGAYQVRAALGYADRDPVDRAEAAFSLPTEQAESPPIG